MAKVLGTITFAFKLKTIMEGMNPPFLTLSYELDSIT